jgi:hypothetical protein
MISRFCKPLSRMQYRIVIKIFYSAREPQCRFCCASSKSSMLAFFLFRFRFGGSGTVISSRISVRCFSWWTLNCPSFPSRSVFGIGKKLLHQLPTIIQFNIFFNRIKFTQGPIFCYGHEDLLLQFGLFHEFSFGTPASASKGRLPLLHFD